MKNEEGRQNKKAKREVTQLLDEKVVPRRAVDGPLIPVFHACRESFRRPYIWKVFVLPPQGFCGHSKVSQPICRFWNLFVEEEVLSN